jgi:hypothetical protein
VCLNIECSQTTLLRCANNTEGVREFQPRVALFATLGNDVEPFIYSTLKGLRWVARELPDPSEPFQGWAVYGIGSVPRVAKSATLGWNLRTPSVLA